MPSTEESGPASAVAVAETASAVEVSEDGSDFGKYTLNRHLATGGMAEIYLAEQRGPEGFAKQIVIKRILPHLAQDDQFTEMFLDEARLAANLNHPNIGQIHELGEVDGDYYIAMEYIDGASIEELLEAEAEFPADVAARIIADVLQALEFAHESKDRDGNPLGLVHRDVTPSNIMVSVDGIVKLVDFGVAKAAKKSHKTQTGAVKGKFAYMAPEQVESQEIDRRADIFAIGIVLYELLTGEKPFGEELAAVSRILHEDPVDPAELRPGVPDPYARIVKRALQKEAGDRYPTAHTMLLDVETALRMRNSYVGPREISYVVRRHRGLELPAGVDLAAADTGVFAADRSADLPLAGKDPALMETAALTVSDADEEVVSPAEPEASRSISIPIPQVSRRTVVASTSVAVALAIMAGAVGWLSSRETVSDLVTGEAQTVVLNTERLAIAGAEPEALFHPEGAPILIDSIPSTEIYNDGKLVGTTPYQTKLKPGRHRIELAHGDDRKTAEFEVTDGRFNRARFDFEELGEKAEKPASKRRKRGGAGSRLKSKFKGIFR